MSGALTWKLTASPQTTRVELAGEITEFSSLSRLLEEVAPTPNLVLDLAQVRRVNSCGVREWLDLVDALSLRATSLVLERCSVPIVNQLNLVARFSGRGRVSSVFAPYLCERCDAEHTRLVELGPSTSLGDGVPCPDCGEPMIFDDLPETYLSFRSQ